MDASKLGHPLSTTNSPTLLNDQFQQKCWEYCFKTGTGFGKNLSTLQIEEGTYEKNTPQPNQKNHSGTQKTTGA